MSVLGFQEEIMYFQPIAAHVGSFGAQRVVITGISVCQ